MSSTRDLAKSIFLNALELTSAEKRGVYLDSKCGSDESLRREVEELLSHQQSLGGFLKEPDDDDAEPTIVFEFSNPDGPGASIGPYKLREQIGEGGFGVVFLAEQTSPVRREVALKVVKAGMDTKEVIARFEAERQALAMMEHPNIAKVLDGGSTASGRPYFVMELVPGIPITEYCDQCRLTTEERLRLYLSVCQAVQHAHQKGVIHRDLKPSNILVAMQDGTPTPKIIDFGVAKAINQRLTENTLRTRFAQFLGTPLYMSPEQAELSPLGVDTRSDIYSLGVLLYELLTGSTPFEKERLRSASFDELRQIIREEEPPKPSTRLSTLVGDVAQTLADRHRTEARQLTQTLRGDLDWIVLKAMEKDRTRRYATVNGLARDVERYLQDEPVEACPPSTAYRARKFVRRNKAAISTLALIVAALVIGTGLASWQAIRATAERNRAMAAEELAAAEAARSEQVAQFLQDTLTAAGPSVARGRDATLLKEVLAQTTERVERDLKGQPEVQGDLWYTLGVTYQDIGDHRSAVAMLDNAVSSYRQSSGDPSIKLAVSLGHLGKSQSFLEQVADGKANAQSGLEMARRIGDKTTLAECLFLRATSCQIWGMTSLEAIPYLEEALDLYREIGDEPIAMADCMLKLAGCISDDEQNLTQVTSLTQEAHKLYVEHLGADHPQTISPTWTLGQVLLNHGNAVEAEPLLRDTLAKHEETSGKQHPINPIIHRMLASSLALQDRWDEAFEVINMISDKRLAEADERQMYCRVINTFCSSDQKEKAAMALKLMRKRYEEFLAADEPNIGMISRYQRDLAPLYIEVGSKEQALEMHREFVHLLATSAEAVDSYNAERLNNIVWEMVTNVDPDFRNPQFALELAQRVIEKMPNDGDYWNTLGIAHYRVGNYAEAVEAWKNATKLSSQGHRFDGFYLAMAHWRLDNKEEARRWYVKSVKWMDENQPNNKELQQFRSEAAALLGIDDEQATNSTTETKD